TLNLISNGIPNADEDLVMVNELPLNSQASLGCYLDSLGLIEWKQFVAEKVVNDIENEKVQDSIKRIRIATTVDSIYLESLILLEKLREMGYYLTKEEREEQNE